MKTQIKKLSLLPVLIIGFGLIPGGRVAAQTFKSLYTFTDTTGPKSVNSDGAGPQGTLILAGGMLYGTANAGGTNGSGTVFKVPTNGMVLRPSTRSQQLLLPPTATELIRRPD
ncbi:exported hypothetical protein [Verrucomicrobia bacterium]|nr:exported hypothetical protein [Verrucomicrobiota bacterium]